MKYSRKTSKNYYVWSDDEPVRKLPKGVTDKALKELDKAVYKLRKALVDCTDIQDFVDSDILPWDMESDHLIKQTEDILENIASVRDLLETHNDREENYEEVFNLVSFGYKKDIYGIRPMDNFVMYTKTKEDSDVQEVVEEIVVYRNGSATRRLRTIEWQKTDFGKQSMKIRYKNLPIGARLQKAINNSIPR